jgi:hypothetical protein
VDTKHKSPPTIDEFSSNSIESTQREGSAPLTPFHISSGTGVISDRTEDTAKSGVQEETIHDDSQALTDESAHNESAHDESAHDESVQDDESAQDDDIAVTNTPATTVPITPAATTFEDGDGVYVSDSDKQQPSLEDTEQEGERTRLV